MSRKDIQAQVLDILKDDTDLQEELEQKLEASRLVGILIAMRAKAGLSQVEMAKRMHCSQSRISKIEHSLDKDLTMNDIQQYTAAVGSCFSISFSAGRKTLFSCPDLVPAYQA